MSAGWCRAPDPCRGLQGYITTYQSIAAAPDLHLAEFLWLDASATRRMEAAGRQRGR